MVFIDQILSGGLNAVEVVHPTLRLPARRWSKFARSATRPGMAAKLAPDATSSMKYILSTIFYQTASTMIQHLTPQFPFPCVVLIIIFSDDGHHVLVCLQAMNNTFSTTSR